VRVLVCVKRVPAPGAKINVTPDGLAVDTAFLGFTMSPHEECAVEEAVRLIERHGGEATVLTLGPAEAEEQLRYSASIGVKRAALVTSDGGDIDPQRTSAILAEAIAALEDRDGTFDLVLMGNESADSSGYQVGIRVAHALRRPVVNGIKGIDVDEATGQATLRKSVDAGFEVYRVSLPAVAGVKEGINLPRYPTMKGRLDAKKVPLDRLEHVGTAGGQQLTLLHRPQETASTTIMLGTGPDAAGAVVDMLSELGLLTVSS
jgi:electron transfer flavoprotein beta subunit